MPLPLVASIASFWLLLSFVSLEASLQLAWREAPWFPVAFEMQPELQWRCQRYERLTSEERSLEHHSRDHFGQLYGSFTWWNDWEVAAAYSVASTTTHRFLHSDQLFLRCRYLLLDDVVGDPVSLTMGVAIYQTFGWSRSDPSCFSHGAIATELQCAVGKEWGALLDWRYRSWLVATLGVGDHGSAYGRACFGSEYHADEGAQWGLAIDWLSGCGHEQLSLDTFSGYGSLRHRRCDGQLYGRCPLGEGVISVGYSYCFYAKNSPVHARQFWLSYLYPFGP